MAWDFCANGSCETALEKILWSSKKVKMKFEHKKLEEYKTELERLGKLKNIDPLFIKELITKINEESL
ncbi:MAG: hypothetical protein LBF13_05665 [Campylobacteraceae bacterium]|nr:hypothetical protein [Campylobacteraceae bacterium]